MDTIDIEVTLRNDEPLALAADAYSLTTRLVAWPGLVCAGNSVDHKRRTMSARFQVTATGKRFLFLRSALEHTLMSIPAVESVNFRLSRLTEQMAA